ncbi:metal ABC transporter permease [Ramlibacter sp. AW1]|uniref:Metal ABC transporter permease n=1 Tax=Ramlibacter aurantiacus TaxID=2801330 RepID=A0A936ZFD6_9BURK|nr:metal ABC transporter permease [Ramlibacter aurantiacus]MBL0418877.1 metal ABC transporter permease [Ramlibacter aurantiacus]
MSGGAAELAWLAAPLAALLAACLVLVPLGVQVLRRGVVFIDLAVAQVAACGTLAAGLLVEQPSAVVQAGSAAAAALAGAAGVWWLARRWPHQREALIGLVYVAAASAALLAASHDPHGRERLSALLAADVLWADWGALGGLAVAAVVVPGLALVRRWLDRDALFYPVFAIALSVAVPVLGLYVVFGLLIGPALWARRGGSLPASIGAGALACAGGLAFSTALDWPSGACVALALCLLGLATTLKLGQAPRQTY